MSSTAFLFGLAGSISGYPTPITATIISLSSIVIMEFQKFLNRAKLPKEYEQKLLNMGIEPKI